MRIEPVGHLGQGPSQLAFASTTAPASTGDEIPALVLLGVVLVILWVLVQLAVSKAKRLSPGEKAPWDGRYVSSFRARAEARMEEGKTLPPPQPSSVEGAKWRLKESKSTSRWIVVAFLLGLLGLLCFGGQIDTAGVQGPVVACHPEGTTLLPQGRDHLGARGAGRVDMISAGVSPVNGVAQPGWRAVGGAAGAARCWRS